jgi:hypothetical protein
MKKENSTPHPFLKVLHPGHAAKREKEKERKKEPDPKENIEEEKYL